MKRPEFVVFDIKEECQEFKNSINDLVVKTGPVDVNGILLDTLTVVLDCCEDWEDAWKQMCSNCISVMNRYVDKAHFESRVDIYNASISMAFQLKERIEKHHLDEFGSFYYGFEKFEPSGLLVLRLLWDSAARPSYEGGKDEYSRICHS